MTLSETHQGAARAALRNPFGVMDVPGPDDAEVLAFAAGAMLEASADDANAAAWGTLGASGRYETIAGNWSSRWNGGADPTIPGDTTDQWKQGLSQVREAGARVYLLFAWDHGARRGLIDARRAGDRLTGKYVNLTDPAITRPWAGLIVSNQRIDGRWTGGRLDFRR
jgi:hypothetical protein